MGTSVKNMKTKSSLSTLNKDIFLTFKKKAMEIPEPFPVKKFRKTSWAEMEKVSWSDLNREDWRYTKYDAFFPSAFVYSDTDNTNISGLTSKDISSGVEVAKYPEQPNKIIPFIQNNDRNHCFNDKWTFLNAALFNRGVFVEIPKNYTVEGFLYIHNIFKGKGSEFPLTYLKLNEGSELNVIEEFTGEQGALKEIISNTVIILEDNAKLNHVHIQNLSEESKTLHYQNVSLNKDARFRTHSVQIGSKILRVIQNIELRAPGSNLKNYGLLYGSHKQHMDIETNQHHKASNTRGELLYRHVLADSARSIFKGKIVIGKGNTFCNSSQKNENLLLSPKAEAISLPKLEILNNEVQCNHGSTISSIDEDQLFYLASRGIGNDDARKMIIEGFFEGIIKKSATDFMAGLISKRVKEVL